MSKKTEFYSVKLPHILNDFMGKEAVTKNITEMSILIDAWVKEPKITVPLRSLNECAGSFILVKQKSRFKAEKKLRLQAVNLGETIIGLKEELESLGFSTYSILIRSIIYIINSKSYHFIYHAPSKAVTLKKIDGKDIGIIGQKKIDELLKGDLAFCAPSHCYRVFVEKWHCE